MVFEKVISLGGLCQTSYTIKDRFGFNTSSPFDWLITPLSALKHILRTRGALFGLSVHCETRGSAAQRKGYTVFCSEYRVAYQHEFMRDEDKRPIVTEESLAVCRSKLTHKYNKMHETLTQGRPTLFIRLAGHHDGLELTPEIDDPRPVVADDLNELCAIIARSYPDLPFRLAFVYRGSRTALLDTGALDPRISLFRLETISDWRGDKEEWGRIYDSFDFDLAGAERAVLEHLL